MTTPPRRDNLIGLTALDASGDKIGSVGQVYLADGTGEAEWVTVKTGLYGTGESFAPLYGSSVSGGRLVLAVSRQLVQDAPITEIGGRVSEAEATALDRHYAGYLGATQAGLACAAD